MEFSFVGVDDAEATVLAQELRLDLLREGVPTALLSLEPASGEHMSGGSVLLANLELAAHAIGAIGYIACFVKCVHEVAFKHQVSIRISGKDGISIDIPASGANPDVIEKAIAELRKSKTDS